MCDFKEVSTYIISTYRLFSIFTPQVTSGGLFKAGVKSVTFNEVRKLTLNDPKFVIWPRTQIFYKKFSLDLTYYFELLFVKNYQLFD